MQLFALPQNQNMTMRGKHFESIQDIKATTTLQLKTLTRGPSELQQKDGKNGGTNGEQRECLEGDEW